MRCAAWYRARAHLRQRPCGCHGHGVPRADGGTTSKATVSPGALSAAGATVTQGGPPCQATVNRTRNQKHQTTAYDQRRFVVKYIWSAPVQRLVVNQYSNTRSAPPSIRIFNVRNLGLASACDGDPENALAVLCSHSIHRYAACAGVTVATRP